MSWDFLHLPDSPGKAEELEITVVRAKRTGKVMAIVVVALCVAAIAVGAVLGWLER